MALDPPRWPRSPLPEPGRTRGAGPRHRGAGRGLSAPSGPGKGQPEGAAGEGAAALCGAEGGKLTSGVVRMKQEATSLPALGAAAALTDGVSPSARLRDPGGS